MGLTAVRSVLCLLLHTETVHKLVLDCPYEEEELKSNVQPDFNYVKNEDAMNYTKSIDEIGMIELVYPILKKAFSWYGQNCKKLREV